MRIDEEEIRFWVRKIKVITTKKNTNIETDLYNEIPKFLTFLTQLPEIDFSKSRMVFTKEEIETESLHVVMEESRSQLRKEIGEYFDDWFMNNDGIEFIEATAKDIKEKWFLTNNQYSVSYIRKVIKDEMKLVNLETKKYKGFPDSNNGHTKTGLPFVFKNPYHIKYQQFKQTELSVDEPSEEKPRFA